MAIPDVNNSFKRGLESTEAVIMNEDILLKNGKI
jgi:hypothetical protein